MTLLRIPLLLALLSLGVFARAETPEVVSDVTSTFGGETILHLSFITTAPPEKLWQALTSPEDLTRWAAKRVRVELRIGGVYEFYFRPENPPGRRGMEGTKIVSFVPGKMLSYSGGTDSWNVWLIEPAGDQQLLHLYVMGSGSEWSEKSHERLAALTEMVRKLAAFVQP
jgi:uncharacterized protein YndB with AHSA1/START domain